MPEFSIVTCTYNCAKFIKRCYYSILQQTYSNWEWVVVDDCSSDGTFDILNSFNDPRIKYFKLDKNMGRGPARNYALSLSIAEWCIMLDMDDLMMPNRLQEALVAKNEGYDFMVSSTVLTNEKYQFTGIRSAIYNNKLHIFTHATLCINSKLLQKIGYSKSRYAEDQRVILMVPLLGKGLFNELPLYVYHENASLSLSGAISSNKAAFLNIFELIIQEPLFKISILNVFYTFSFLFKYVSLSFLRVCPSFYNRIMDRRVKLPENVILKNNEILEFLNYFSLHFPIR